MVQVLETKGETAVTVILRLSVMNPNGKIIDYDEPLARQDQTSFDAARQKLSDKQREKIAEGWDFVRRSIVHSSEKDGVRILNKEWELIGDPGTPPVKQLVERTDAPSTVPPGTVQVDHVDKPDAPITVPGGAVPTPRASPANASFLEELGELCVKHQVVIEGDHLQGVRLAPFNIKAFLRLMRM